MNLFEYKTTSIDLFYEILNTGDYTLISKDEKEFENHEIEVLKFHFEKIYVKFLDDKGDKETRQNFETILELLNMEQDFVVIRNAIDLILSTTKIKETLLKSDEKDPLIKDIDDNLIELSKAIEKAGDTFTPQLEIKPQIETLERNLKILSANIRQKKINNDHLFKKINKKVQHDIYLESALIEELLNIKIDPVKTMLPKYVAYLKRVRMKSDGRQRSS